MNNIAVLIVLLCVSVGGCQRDPGYIDSALSKELTLAAKTEIAHHHPSWANELNGPARILDARDRWIVMFDVPEGYIGGGPVAEIEKANRKVLKVYHLQ
jgi:hypothetical protein